MKESRKYVRLYNVLFPVWMLLLLPQIWLIVLPGNFLIDSLVLLLGMSIWKITDKKQFYKQYILKIFGFGLLSDMIGSAGMLLATQGLEVLTGSEWYLSIPGLVLAGVMIFILHYRVTFRKCDRLTRKRFSLLFAIATAPYTFLIPVGWLY